MNMGKRAFIKQVLDDVGQRLNEEFPVRQATQKEPHEFVTDQDKQTESYIRDKIQSNYPDDGIIGEEHDDYNSSSNTYWVIDPIDGTTNYSHDIPFFCAAIASITDDTVTHSGVVSPMHESTWTAVNGEGAWRDDSVVRVDDVSSSDAVLGFCHGSEDTHVDWLSQHYSTLKSSFADARQFGAADLEIALTGSGSLGGFIGKGIKPWDFLPGCLIADEAGCAVTGFDGESWMSSENENVVVGAPSVHEDLLDLVSDGR
jgi:myo-inositol-1(or 4)-monophosphatase